MVSPDGNNVYTASEVDYGPIAEFSRGANGELSQLTGNDNCIEEAGQNLGCLTTGTGIGSGDRLAISPDGADVYAAAPDDLCTSDGGCSDVAEFARLSGESLAELVNPNTCIQDEGVEDATECPNETVLDWGARHRRLARQRERIRYWRGNGDLAEFARAIPTLTVSLAGAGSGGVSDGDRWNRLPAKLLSRVGIGQVVTLTATPAFASEFSGWSGGGCSGTGTCQVVMDADTAVTATFSPIPPAAPSRAPGRRWSLAPTAPACPVGGSGRTRHGCILRVRH